MFTAQELEEMALVDREIEAGFRLEAEDMVFSKELDRAAKLETVSPEKRNIAQSKKTYRSANREKISEYQKAYREANRDKISEYQKAYYRANRERIAEYKKAYRRANREKIAEYKKAYYKANRDKRCKATSLDQKGGE